VWFLKKLYQNVPIKLVVVGFECHTSIQYFKLLLNIPSIKYSMMSCLVIGKIMQTAGRRC